MSEINEVVIVGSGPAGYTAAIYAARAQLKPIIYEGSVSAGGALMNTTEVENFPGFADGVMGPELMESMRKQVERFDAKIMTEDIVDMKLAGDIKELTDGSGNTIKTKSVILAMGSAYKEIILKNTYLGIIRVFWRVSFRKSKVICCLRNYYLYPSFK